MRACDNYFKVMARGLKGASSIFPFSNRDFLSLDTAWRQARSLAVLRDGRIAVYTEPKPPGPWRQIPTVGEGIDGNAKFSEYIEDMRLDEVDAYKFGGAFSESGIMRAGLASGDSEPEGENE